VEEEAEEEEDVSDVEETLDMSDAALASTRLGSIELTNTLGVRTMTSATILTHLIDMNIPVDQLLIVGDDGSFQQYSKTDLDMQARVLVARVLYDPNVDCLDKQATFVIRNGRHLTGMLHGEGAPLKANPQFVLYAAYTPYEPDKDGRKTPIIKGGVVYSGYGYGIVVGVLRHNAGAKSQLRFFILVLGEKGPEKPIWCVAAPCPAHDTRTAPRAHLSLPSA